MAVQDSYSQYRDTGHEGDIANGEHATILSREVETAALPFARAVTHGTADSGVVAGGANVFQGVSVRTNVQAAANANDYAVGATANIMQSGVVRVAVTETVTPETVPAFATADGTFGASGTAAHTDVPNGRYESSGGAGALVLLRLG